MKGITLRFLALAVIVTFMFSLNQVAAHRGTMVSQAAGGAGGAGAGDKGSSGTVAVIFLKDGGKNEHGKIYNFLASPFMKWVYLIVGILLLLGGAFSVLKTSGAVGSTATA